MLNEKSTQKSAQQSTQKTLNGKSTQKSAQKNTQKSYIAQWSAQNSVFTQKSISQKNDSRVHKHIQESAQKSYPKSGQGKKFSKKCWKKYSEKLFGSRVGSKKLFFSKKTLNKVFFVKKVLIKGNAQKSIPSRGYSLEIYISFVEREIQCSTPGWTPLPLLAEYCGGPPSWEDDINYCEEYGNIMWQTDVRNDEMWLDSSSRSYDDFKIFW